MCALNKKRHTSDPQLRLGATAVGEDFLGTEVGKYMR